MITVSELERTRRNYHRTSPGAREHEENQVLDMVVAGWTHREIAKELGVSIRTVGLRQTAALARKSPVAVSAYRDVMNEQLDHAFRMNVLLGESGDVAVIERALDRSVRLIERKARLNGADAPILVEATVVEVTAQERALADLLAQAERDQAVKEAELAEHD